MSIQIQISQLHKNYGTFNVLQNLNLTIQPSEFVAIVGKSGCGKSTLLRLIAQLESSTQGQILNQEQKVLASNYIRVMFQDPRLLPWKTVLQNIVLGLPKQQHPMALKILEKVGLLDKKELWPSQLSGGQRQRVALARALLHKPNILLFDEPLGALDALTRLEMQKLIEKIWQEQQFTAVLVTHDVSEAVQLADRIILLDQGMVSKTFDVPLPRPRVKSQVFFEIEQQVLNHVLQT